MSGKAGGRRQTTDRHRAAGGGGVAPIGGDTVRVEERGAPARNEGRWVVLAATGVMLLTCLPYLIAARPGFAGPDLHFAGALWGVDDYNVYRSYIRQHAEGNLFARNQYTTEPQVPRFVNLLFLLMGLVCRMSGLPPALVYHLFRVVGGVLLLYLLYRLAAEVGLERRGRWLTLLLASFSSGLGWIVYRAVAEGRLPPEAASRLAPIDVAAGWVAVPEGVIFLTLLVNALFVAGVALMVGAMLWGLRAAREPGWGAVLVCGGLLFLLGNVHTYDVIGVYLVLLLWFGLEGLRRRLSWGQAAARYALIAALGLPTVLWQYHVQSIDPTWAAKYAVPKTSPPLSGYLLGYGLPLALAILGVAYALSRRKAGCSAGAAQPAGRPLLDAQRGALFPVLWLVVGFALVYAPLGFQRKLAEGLHVPICLLAALALQEMTRRLPRSSFGLVAGLAVALTLPSNVYYVADGLAHAKVNNLDLAPVWYPPAYLTSGEQAALRWLREHTSPNDVALCSTYFGNHVPAAAPCRVVAGHWDETVHFGRYLRLVLGFYAPFSPPEVRREYLRQSSANLVVYGPQERLLQRLLSLGEGSRVQEQDPAESVTELRAVFRSDNTTIYAWTGSR